MAGEIFAFGDENSLRMAGKATRQVLNMRDERPSKPKGVKDGEGGGCDTQNAIWDIALLGKPNTGGVDLPVIVNAVTETKTFPYDCTAANFKTILATHTQIDAADLTVTGQWPNSTMRVEFGAALAGQDILHPTADWTALAGGSGLGVICMLAQKGHS